MFTNFESPVTFGRIKQVPNGFIVDFDHGQVNLILDAIAGAAVRQTTEEFATKIRNDT